MEFIDVFTIESWSRFFLSACLFQLLGAETHVLKKAPLESAFGSAQNATFWKKLRFGPRLRTRKPLWSFGGPF